MPDNMRRLEEISLSLPEAERVDIEAWDGHPTFRVRGKNFVFCNLEATSLTVKLSKEEAEAVVATEPGASAAGLRTRSTRVGCTRHRHRRFRGEMVATGGVDLHLVHPRCAEAACPDRSRCG